MFSLALLLSQIVSAENTVNGTETISTALITARPATTSNGQETFTVTTLGHTYTITTTGVPNAGAINQAGKVVALGAVAGSVMLLL
ncbi:hypothetical protein DASB73_020240 [Starmerella bacillaris]|uniref:BIG2 domain-containing protein n=1 Tax=Starmerella bacillaris TaxID=1247836 RepID=A0AAV5RIU0_STABA|nr:hypothetical protein DASB73_020240 [Starmerella bacillaris]